MPMKLLCLLPAVASALLAVHKEQPPNPDEVPLPPVPAVAAAGKSGFPELPTVSAMLDESTQTLSGISSQAQKLQQQMLQVQQESAQRMQRQKAVFDRKLQEQEEKNRGIVKENALIAKSIMEMKAQNAELLEHAKSLQDGTSLRHHELTMLQSQLAAAQDFLKDSLTQTDDSTSPELQVMHDESKPLSFLELYSEPEEPEGLLTMLTNEVKVMKQQGKESEEKLKKLFKTDFEAGVKRHQALLAQQKVLKETLEKMKSYHSRLETADKHLQSTMGTMDHRLHDGGLFMQKLSELTLAKPEAALQALETLEKKK